ncbi:MAG: hypothetical protein IJ675_07980 [Pseudobutyrivibrio sp.]|nr:hypothetical protein [Pseudobutyrivibrio sp.]
MANKIDPFTRTPGVAGKAYIDNGVADEIITNFSSDESAKYVYKITGLRGAGKSVEYSKVIRTLKEKPEWLVYPLSASGDVISTLISKLSMESFIDSNKKTTSISSTTSIGGTAVVVSGNETVNVSKSISANEHYYSDEATLARMISSANENGFKILIGIDDIAKTPEVIRLLSIVGSLLLEGAQLYLLVTGLSENIEDFSSEKNLTFFKRADSKEIKGLNKFDITYMYEKLLNVDSSEARKIEAITMGYAYAYQVLGSLYFTKREEETIDDIMPDFERILFKDSYELIWQSLSPNEKDFIRCIYKSSNGKAEEIKSLLGNPASYSVYRNRLMNKHIVDGDTRGYLTIRLPRFDKYIEIWGDD